MLKRQAREASAIDNQYMLNPSNYQSNFDRLRQYTATATRLIVNNVEVK